MSLREDLAKRLQERFEVGSYPEHMGDTPERHFHHGWLCAADEVIRQMAWASQYGKSFMLGPDYFGTAPPEWKP